MPAISSAYSTMGRGRLRTQRFAEAALSPPVPDENFPYVIWDSWKYQFGINEITLRRNAEIAARLGIEVFVIDLGAPG